MGLKGNIYGFLGYYNHSRGKLDKALDWYKKAEKNDVSNPNYRMAHGVLLLRSGYFEEARAIFDKILVFYPRNESVKNNAKINLSLVYWKLGDLDAAIERMRELHNKLKNSRTYGTLGYLLIEKGDYEEALKFNLNALEYDDTDPVVLDNIGQTYYRMGDMDNAFLYFQKAYEQKGDQAVTLYYLGDIYKQRGELEKAREMLEKALECNISALSTISREKIEEKLKELG
ncbi:MAG TPA: tetratricopeptide repeat protein [Clostridiales bacterium]|nr:tetratricopeptide repeat protein [Clostridiales bacterium]